MDEESVEKRQLRREVNIRRGSSLLKRTEEVVRGQRHLEAGY
jgi:hypothetical protein